MSRAAPPVLGIALGLPLPSGNMPNAVSRHKAIHACHEGWVDVAMKEGFGLRAWGAKVRGGGRCYLVCRIPEVAEGRVDVEVVRSLCRCSVFVRRPVVVACSGTGRGLTPNLLRVGIDLHLLAGGRGARAVAAAQPGPGRAVSSAHAPL